MAGKNTDGVNTGKPKWKDVRAYAEGVEHRMADTATNNPKTDNPHGADRVGEAASWDAGWDDANAGTVEQHVAGWNRTAPT
jgi:hypothetical protein